MISVPNFGGWQRRRFGDRWYHLDLPRHRVHFTAEAVGRALERAGLEPVSLTNTLNVSVPAEFTTERSGKKLKLPVSESRRTFPPALGAPTTVKLSGFPLRLICPLLVPIRTPFVSLISGS